MLESGTAIKYYEEDIYSSGCQPDTGGRFIVEITFNDSTIEGLLTQIKEYYDVTDDDILLNACGEDGRIDIQVLEDKDSYKATEQEIELWKHGEIKLYLSTYIYHIEEVQRKPYKFN